ncbi:MAG: hypothetical protein A2045_04795 [Rhodocyclales bacterium GWA2_65_20]|nr:MAG: hypothetical protein A2045_04795 [Rhodocyclales bacterium GWA2_65_20]
MASVSSTSSATQFGLQQLRQLEARRNADQAEQKAQSLKAQASDARHTADQAQENARSLGVQADQAQAQAGKARQGLAAFSTEQQQVTRLANTVDQVLTREQEASASSPTQSIGTSPAASSAAPVVNTQGQVTGQIVNTTA